MIEIKKCKLCLVEKKYANNNFCFKCIKKRERDKKELKAQKKLERKLASKGYIENVKKALHKKAWTLMSEWVRHKDATPDGFNSCYTCGCVKHYKELQAGHYKHGRLDFDERNLKPQCARCNKYYSGKLDVYAERLLKDYGQEWLTKLVADAWQTLPYTIEQLKEIIIDLKLKISKL